MYIATRKISDEDRIEIATLAAEVFGFAYGEAYKDKRQLAEYIAEVFEPDSFISELRADCVECLMGEVDGEPAGLLKMATTEPPALIDSLHSVEVNKVVCSSAIPWNWSSNENA